MTPTALVQRQLDAYNQRQLEPFLAVYADDVTVYRLPGAEPSLRGKAALRDFYAGQRFNLPDLHAELVKRIEFGNKVIDHERVSGVAEQPFEVAAVYEIIDDKIQNVWFLAAD